MLRSSSTQVYMYLQAVICTLMLCAGTQEQCVVAIGHMARIIRGKSSLLNKTNKNRRVPK